MPNWLFFLARLRQRLWLTVALYSALGLAAALLAAMLGPYVPSDFPLKLGSDAVDDILTILASSMLAVATFSLATLVTAYTSVVSNVAPHAAKLLVGDPGIRNALGTFIGAFIYGIVGIVAVHTGYYGAQGRVILFFITVAVLVLVVVAMVRWVAHLSELGQPGNVMERVVKATEAALEATSTVRSDSNRAAAGRSAAAAALTADGIGYVQNVNLRGLQRLADEAGLFVEVDAPPGTFVFPGKPLLWVTGRQAPDACREKLRSQLTVGRERTHDQDPLYGLQVMGEIAARALSPGVNDPGGALDVIARTLSLIERWIGAPAEEGPELSRVTVRPLPISEVLEEALLPIAIHGASNLRVQCDLQIGLGALVRLQDRELAEASRRLSRRALEHALPALALDADRERLLAAAVALDGAS